MNNSIFLYSLSICLLVPVAFELFSVAGKPAFLVLSDLLIIAFFAITILHLLHINKIRSCLSNYAFVVASSFFILLSLSIAGSIRSESLIPLFSSIKLLKSFIFFYLGYYFSKRIAPENFVRCMCVVSMSIVYILFVSDIIWGNFPLPRLGGWFFNFEVYGFPNSAAVFYCVFFAFCFLGFKINTGLLKVAFIISTLLISIIIIGTLSRAAMLNLLLYIGLMFLLRQRGFTSLIIALTLGAFLLINYLFLNYPELVAGLANKFAKFESGNDSSNGRFEIWVIALDLFANSPLWGHLFEPFSNYASYNTPHNQNIELLYKGGLVGLFFYYFPLAYSFIIISFRKLYHDKEQCIRDFCCLYFALVISISITNNVQPNFSFTPTGSLIFFISGYLFRLTRKTNFNS